MSAPSVAVIGGGLLGLLVAHQMSEQDVDVTVFERANSLGGLLGSFDFDGRPVERFPNVILPTDDRVQALATDLGLDEEFRFHSVEVGLYDAMGLYSIGSVKELMTFPPLSTRERLRMAAFVAACRRIEGHEDLDTTPLDAWLRRRSGHDVYARLWQPLLEAKLDGWYADLPATYVWARVRRMVDSRDIACREVMGSSTGGYQTMIDRLADGIRARGGQVVTGTEVHWIVGDAHGIQGLVVGGGLQTFDHVVSTLFPTQNARLFSPEMAARIPPDGCRYLGAVTLVLRNRTSVSPFHTLSIADRRIPLTTVVETTHVIDPETVGGHLLYATRCVRPGHPDLTRPHEDVVRDYLRNVQAIFPGFCPDDVLATAVQREDLVEPVHVLGAAGRLPDMFPVPGLTLASRVQVYPGVVTGQGLIGVADRAAGGTLARLRAAHRVAA